MRPERRVGISERCLREADEECPRGPGILRRLQRLPVGLGLHPAADPALSGREGELERGDDEQGQRNRCRLTHPSAPPRHPHQDPGAGKREQCEPGECLGDVVARVVTDLVGEDDPYLVVREASVDHGAPENDLAGGSEADRVGIRLAGRAADVLDRDGNALDALLSLERLRRPLQARDSRAAQSRARDTAGRARTRLRSRRRRSPRGSTRSRRGDGRGTSRSGGRRRSR